MKRRLFVIGQNQTVTESVVEINFSLIEVAIGNEHCANFEEHGVSFCDDLVTGNGVGELPVPRSPAAVAGSHPKTRISMIWGCFR